MSTQTKSDPTIFIIFGGTGDLNSRKIAPALYNLFLDGWMPKQFSIIGTGRTKLTDEQFRKTCITISTSFRAAVKLTRRNGPTL
jgi:glucose-6-phosphate 1-dehydrogenase